MIGKMCVKKIVLFAILVPNSTYTTGPVSIMVFFVTTTSVVIKLYRRIDNGLYQTPEENTRKSIINRAYIPTTQPG